MEDIDEIVREFLVESYENLDQLDRDLVELEENPGDRPLLSSVFRTIHTIKGTSGFLAFSRLERVTHAGENLLVELRDGRRQMDQVTTDVLLRTVDTVRLLLDAIERTGGEGDVDVDVVVEAIVAVQEGRTAAQAPPATATAPAAAESTADVPHPREAPADENAEPVAAAVAAVTAEHATEAPATAAPDKVPAIKQIVTRVPKDGAAASGPADGTPPGDAPAPVLPTPHVDPAAQRAADEALEAAAVQALAAAALADLSSGHEYQPTMAPAAAPLEEVGTLRGASESSVRIDVELLDRLMRQVGELVLVRNRLTRLAAESQDVDLTRSAQQLNLIASELQDGVMRTRMQPIENVWAKMPRVVRDLAATCGREVRLELVGGDTELDRSLLEAVKDPLTHLVRNAVDHGIEPPGERVAAGKPSHGTLELRAFHAGGQVVVEVRDDGRGIDPQKVAESAVRKGLRTPEQVAQLGQAEMLGLLFLPGFSTAAAVTNVSGRGVGMDVVRTRIEAVGGTVDVESTVGVGTSWRLRIPLTLAIMPSLSVECDGDVYAVPQVHVLELVALDDRAEQSVEHVHEAPVYRLRGELLPLVPLHDVLGLSDGEPAGSRPGVIVVVQADDNRFGLLVDRVLATEEIVVTPLAAQLKSVSTYAGTTVLGDGRVALILDMQSIAREAMPREHEHASVGHASAAVEEAHETEQLLVARIGEGRLVAMPLAGVARLEHVRSDEVETVGDREVVQYRGSILPLARVDSLVGATPEDRDELLLVVYERGSRSAALVVEDIVDIVEDHAEHSDIDAAGLVGSTVVHGRVTELLDLPAALLAADHDFESDDLLEGAA
ncbi:chemotaxis protein CheA [Cellulomonas sp. H30R-01]|uniref:chemotaxis protein CheA n=1 Tax=Cellulomonas sp. H30R-01 TaxID=2704467 RepID=UPI00138C247F|nr:chemotaxis protein CheA [Cellulomonas sp. H30R-01]QHT56905.1 chemotaxis protein CheA [Cellulomonas sp. H30R-01]